MTSPSVFSGYRQRRLQGLASRISLAPPDAWNGHDALPALFHEQLTLGTRFYLPIQATARFDASSATAAAESLCLVTREAILSSLSGDFDDPDYLTVWEIIESASNSLSLFAPVTKMGQAAEEIAGRLAEEMQRVPGIDPTTPIETLSARLSLFLTAWSAQAPACTPGEARILFLGMIYRHVLSAFSAPINFWEILLLKLELAIASPGTSPELARLLSPVFRVAWSALPLQAALQTFWKIHSETTDADAVVAERITILAVLTRAGGAAAALLRSAITPEWVASTATSHTADINAPWRSTIVQHLELSAYQPILEAADHWSRLTSAASEINVAVGAHKQALRKISDDLSQGMSGKDTSDLYLSLASELLARGLWVSMLTSNPAEARELYLQPAVRELGLDASVSLWKKLSRLSSSLQMLVSNLPPSLPWGNIPPLLRALEARVLEIKMIPLRWNQPVPEKLFQSLPFTISDGTTRCARDTSFLLHRLAVEQRIHGPQRAEMEIARWYSQHVLPYLRHLPDESFRECWDLLCESGFSPLPEHQALNGAARQFGRNLPRLTAARKLELYAEEFATEIATEVMTALPHYADKVGSAGRVSCIRDNTLTLSQVASLLFSDAANPHEVLTEWWNSSVGGYLATRPNRLFEANLDAIFHALGRKLDSSERSEAFSLIQIVYRESLGIECLESLTGPPTSIAGPLARRLSAGFSPPEPDCAALADAICTILTQKYVTNTATHQALLSAFLTYHRERWTYGNDDIAAGRVLPVLSKHSMVKRRNVAANAILTCVTNPALSSHKDAFLLSESADGFVLALAQQGVAEELTKNADEIAKAYSAAMVAHAPELFKHLSYEDAVSRCCRDQTLLLRSLGERLGQTSPCLFWTDATRWFLELLSPFIQYPPYVWSLCGRTVAKHLGPQLSALENIFLSRWVSHFEHLAHGWASSHALAKCAFNPTDYSFSARRDEDRMQRDLLAAALTARYSPSDGPWSGDALFHRFLLSWPAASRSNEEISSLIDNIMRIAGSSMPHGVSSWLGRTLGIINAVKTAQGSHPSERYHIASGLASAYEHNKAYSLYMADDDDLMIWRQVRANSNPGADLALAEAAIRAHLLHPYVPNRPRALASGFSAAARIRAGIASATLDVSCDAVTWMNLADSLLPHSSTPNTLRSHFTTLSLEWPAVHAGLALCKGANQQADMLLEKVSSPGNQSQINQAAECNTQTNYLAFGYAFRQTGLAAWDPSSTSPRLFFGFAADNHRLLPTTVAAQAHTRVNAALRQALPAGSALAGDAIYGLEAPFFPSTGPLWRTIVLSPNAESSKYVKDLFPCIRAIAEEASSLAYGEVDPRRATMTNRICYYLEALVCCLDESGDMESASELLLLRLSTDIQEFPVSDIIRAFEALTCDLSKHLSKGAALFWRACFIGMVDVARQAALGRYILDNAANLANKATTDAIPEDADLQYRCARDQEHLLSLLGHLLATQSPVRAWLNFTSHLTEITLPHLSHGALELSSMWCHHEINLSSQLDPNIRPALWTWMGAIQRMCRNLPAIRPFVAKVVPSLAVDLAKQHCDDPADWRRFLCAVAASAATPDDGPSPGLALLEKALLATPLGLSHHPHEWVALAETISKECDALLPDNVPNSLKRRLVSLPSIAERLDALTELKGSRLIRACTAQASNPLMQPLWHASLLARSRPEDRLVQSDPADALAATAFGLALKSDEEILTHFETVVTSLGSGNNLSIESPKPTGLLSKFGMGKKSFDWANNPELRRHGNYVIEILSLRAHLNWNDPSYLWYWSSFAGCGALNPDAAEHILEFYQALANSVSSRFGTSHPLSCELNSFVSQSSSRLTGIKLIPTKDGNSAMLPLYMLGIRKQADASTYSHACPMSPDTPTLLVSQAREHGRILTESQTHLIRQAHEEIFRHASLKRSDSPQ